MRQGCRRRVVLLVPLRIGGSCKCPPRPSATWPSPPCAPVPTAGHRRLVSSSRVSRARQAGLPDLTVFLPEWHASSPPVRQLERPRVLVLSGPTAIGKTNLSLELAQRLDGEIISADSMQVYKGMDVGTAKATSKEQSRVPHHLIDVVSPKEPFNAHQFWELAHQATHDVLSRGKVPIVVGGCGFYLNWYLHKKQVEQNTKATPEVVSKIQTIIAQDQGDWYKSLARVQAFDPEFAASIAKNDFSRIVRALEIHAVTGRPPSSFAPRRLTPWETLFDFRCVYVTHSDRLVSSERIDLRCEEMVARGLLEETTALLFSGIDIDSPPAKAIGYSEAISFLLYAEMNELTSKGLVQFLNLFQNSSRRYAKRQKGWFRREPLFHHWLYRDELPTEELLQRIVDLYAMPFEDYMATFDWEKYLESIKKDYITNAMREYSPQLKLFSHPRICYDLVIGLYPYIQNLRRYVAWKGKANPADDMILV